MSSEPSAGETALHEWVDADIEISNWDPMATEQKLSELLQHLSGVKVLSFSEGKVSLEYDPLLILRTDIHDALIRGGLQIKDMQTGPASPVADALHGEE